MFEDILENLGKFWIPDNPDESFTGKISKNNNQYEISVVNVNFKDYKCDYLLLNGYIKTKKLSLVILNDPIKGSHSRVANNTYYIRFLFERIHYRFLNDICFKNINIKIDNIGSVVHMHSLSPQGVPSNHNKSNVLLMEKPYDEYLPVLMTLI